jgi:hypothetical protein
MAMMMTTIEKTRQKVRESLTEMNVVSAAVGVVSATVGEMNVVSVAVCVVSAAVGEMSVVSAADLFHSSLLTL